MVLITDDVTIWIVYLFIIFKDSSFISIFFHKF